MSKRVPSRANDAGPVSPVCCRALAMIAITTLAMVMSLSACASTYDPATGILSLDLGHRDPMVRVRAIVVAERDGRRDLVPLLLDNLSHEEGSVRMVAGTALRKLTGFDFGFKPYATPGARAESIERWRTWWRDEGHGGEEDGGGETGETPPEAP